MYNPQLETFLKVADCGSFNKASEELYISHPAVIKQVNLLESALNLQLFVRTHRGLILTEAGKSLYHDAKYIIQYCHESVNRARNAMQKEESVIRIGTSPMTPGQFLMEMWSSIHEICPDIKFQLVPFENTPQNSVEILKNLGQNIDIVAGLFDDTFLKSRKCDGLSLSRGTVSASRDTIAKWITDSGYKKETEETPKNLVAYYSASGTTEKIADYIAEAVNADMFEIQPAVSYGEDFNTVADRALNEQENGVLPELLNHIENLDQYDTIFVGYPIWWYDMPQMMYSFFDEYDFSGKTIIPFNSHGGSGFSGSVQEIAELEPNADVRTDGLTISRNSMATSESTIVNWLEKIGMKVS